MHTPPSVLRNQGGRVFRNETLDVDGSRAVNALDVDTPVTFRYSSSALPGWVDS